MVKVIHFVFCVFYQDRKKLEKEQVGVDSSAMDGELAWGRGRRGAPSAMNFSSPLPCDWAEIRETLKIVFNRIPAQTPSYMTSCWLPRAAETDLPRGDGCVAREQRCPRLLEAM